MQRIDRRILELTRHHGVAQKNVLGAYDMQPLRGLEYLLHEVAHWLTLGHPIDTIPRRLSTKIGAVFTRIPIVSSDSLEIDTSLITYLAGHLLGEWDDPSLIVRSCRRNLRGREALGEDGVVLEQFRKRWRQPGSCHSARAVELAIWFRPSARSKLVDPSIDIFGV